MSDRINQTRKLASAVLYLHSCDFVHKNIRPDNILIFDPIALVSTDPKNITYPYAVGEPYLVGFDSVRKADAHSSMIRVEEWEKNIYLHPGGNRMAQGDEFTMRHDIYSLRVVLLEISVWGSFTDQGNHRIGRHFWEKPEKGPKKLLPPELLKNRYLEFARSQIPRTIGDKYLDVVVPCLELRGRLHMRSRLPKPRVPSMICRGHADRHKRFQNTKLVWGK
jgi:serine/threonine protein kinase